MLNNGGVSATLYKNHYDIQEHCIVSPTYLCV